MLKKLEIDSRKADLSVVEAMLAGRTAENDPIGVMQLRHRRDEILNQIENLGQVSDGTASVALFFGGLPVEGSRGIQVEFAGKVLDRFQDIVTKRFATEEAGIELRPFGPVPLQGNAHLVVTEMARGSVGFVLEEAANDATLIDTSLKRVVHDVVGMFESISSEDDAEFETYSDSIDRRLMQSFAQFFKQLDEHGATLRVVEGVKDLNFRGDAIRRARERAEHIVVHEGQEEHTGVLYILPEQRKFEIHTSAGTVGGRISVNALTSVMEGNEIREGVIGARWTISVSTKEVQIAGRAPRKSYLLLSIRSATP